MKNVLFIDGVRDNQIVKMVSITSEGNAFDVGGSCNLFNTLNSNSYNKGLAILDATNSSSLNLDSIDLIFNQIAEFDTFKNALAKVDVIINQYNITCLNEPVNIAKTTRDAVSQTLQDIDKLIVPKTIRYVPLKPLDTIHTIKNENFHYPVIIRDTGIHGGDSTHIVHSDKEVRDLHAIALDGREYYLTQYHEYKDEDNLYKKYRLAVVDGEVFIRHCISSDEWMIHAQSRDDIHNNNEKKTLKLFESKIKPKIKPTIKKIKEQVGLDYFGIDCHIDKNMNILIFEINANMNILLRSNNYTDTYVEKIQNSLNSMIVKKLKNV